ncbi:MAG TPA: response regulator [Candidatus Sulfomarinibacteraceae bacterium]|nr:response regulator [Candidatus Sulfomarinibacteraceae bacterium]
MSQKVIIVDDDRELLHLIGLALHRAGFQPIGAANADEALRKVQEEQPALIVLDVMLPGVSGIELCRKLRQEAGTLPLPIIMLSARSHVDDKIEGLEAGADEYLTKPISPKELIARIKALLERTRRLQQSAQSARGHVLGFVGAKGGVGTTTVALNIAATLATRGHGVIAVELHPYAGTFDVQLGHTPRETLGDLWGADSARLNQRMLKMALLSDASGLDVLYGPRDPETWRELEPEMVTELIENLSALADYVLLDLPGTMSAASQAALRQCDLITLVSRGETDSVASGARLLELFKAWGVGRGLVEAVIVNQVPLAMGLTVEQISQELGCDVRGVVPPAADACAAALKRGRPLVLTHPDIAAAEKLSQMADQYIMAE